MTVEVIGPHVFAKKHIVIEVDKLLREAGNSMDVCFNGRRAERRQMGLVLKDFLEGERKHVNTYIYK